MDTYYIANDQTSLIIVSNTKDDSCDVYFIDIEGKKLENICLDKTNKKQFKTTKTLFDIDEDRLNDYLKDYELFDIEVFDHHNPDVIFKIDLGISG